MARGVKTVGSVVCTVRPVQTHLRTQSVDLLLLSNCRIPTLSRSERRRKLAPDEIVDLSSRAAV